MHVELRVANRKANVKRVRINESAVIGRRSSCDVRIVSDEVSREHCRIDVSDVGATITDLGSTNGTFVNSEQLNGIRVAPLKDGDELTIGPAKFRIAFVGMAVDSDVTEKAIDGKVVIADETVYDEQPAEVPQQLQIAEDPEESVVAEIEVDPDLIPDAPETTSLKNEDTDAGADHGDFLLTEDAEQTAEGESELLCDFGSEDQGVLEALDESGEMIIDISDSSNNQPEPEEPAELELDIDGATTQAVSNDEEELDFSEDEIVDILGDDNGEEFNSGIVAGVHSDGDLEVDTDDDQLSDFIKGL